MKCAKCTKNQAKINYLCQRCEEIYKFVEHMLYDFNIKVSVNVDTDEKALVGKLAQSSGGKE